jgi:ribosomal protein L9
LLPPSLQFSSATISPTDHSLHGSVSTVDIANAIKMVSAANGEEGSRVVITPDQIELIGVDGDKIKMIGEYQFEIKMKGTNDFVRRRATVQRQEIH